MRTAKVVNEALGRLMELGGFTVESEADFALIRDEMNDREGYIHAAYEDWDEDNDSRFDITLRSATPPEDMVSRLELDEMSARYEDLKDRYKKAFFSGERLTSDTTEVIDEAEGVKEPDAENITIEDLFKEME